MQQKKYGTVGALVQPISTRWNSSFKMIASLVNSKAAIQKTLKKEDLEEMDFSETEWSQMEFISSWAKFITATLDDWQGEKSSTIDCVFVHLTILHHEAKKLQLPNAFQNHPKQSVLKDFAKEIGQTLIRGLTNYFPKEETIHKATGSVKCKKKYNFLVIFLIFLF